MIFEKKNDLFKIKNGPRTGLSNKINSQINVCQSHEKSEYIDLSTLF